jgi:hypothetical protein
MPGRPTTCGQVDRQDRQARLVAERRKLTWSIHTGDLPRTGGGAIAKCSPGVVRLPNYIASPTPQVIIDEAGTADALSLDRSKTMITRNPGPIRTNAQIECGSRIPMGG